MSFAGLGSLSACFDDRSVVLGSAEGAALYALPGGKAVWGVSAEFAVVVRLELVVSGVLERCDPCVA
jgi:hypothetical protein